MLSSTPEINITMYANCNSKIKLKTPSLDLKKWNKEEKETQERMRGHEGNRKENTVLKSQWRQAFHGEGFFLFTSLCYTKS